MDRKVLIDAMPLIALYFVALSFYGLIYMKIPGMLYGIDGPYYYVQVKHLLTQGRLKYLDPPLAFYVLAGFSLLLGDITLGVKLGSLAVILLSVFPVYYLVKSLTGSRTAGYVSAVLLVLSGELLRMSFDLIKNAMGLTPLLFTLYLLYKSLKDRKMLVSVFSSLTLLLTGLTHILDFGVLLFILLLTFVFCLFSRKDKFKLVKPLIAPFLTGMGLLAAGFSVAWLMGGDPFKGVSLLNRIVTRGITEVPLYFLHPMLTFTQAFIVVCAAVLAIPKLDKAGRLIASSVAIAAFTLNLPFIPQNFLWRFQLMNALFTPLLLGLVVGVVKGLNGKIATALIMLGFILPGTVHHALRAGPSIPPGEYEELKQVIARLPPDGYAWVPDVRLKYWVETLTDRAVKKPEDLEEPAPLMLIVDKRSIAKRRIPFRPPPASIQVYSGRYLEAYLVKPPPRR